MVSIWKPIVCKWNAHCLFACPFSSSSGELLMQILTLRLRANSNRVEIEENSDFDQFSICQMCEIKVRWKKEKSESRRCDTIEHGLVKIYIETFLIVTLEVATSSLSNQRNFCETCSVLNQFFNTSRCTKYFQKYQVFYRISRLCFASLMYFT